MAIFGNKLIFKGKIESIKGKKIGVPNRFYLEPSFSGNEKDL
jgi:hypothetical protein